MGSALGRAWQCGGSRVVATVAGRSERTRTLAGGLELLDSLADVVGVSDIVVSIGPPSAAVQMDTDIAAAGVAVGHRPLVAELNAISPTTVSAVAGALSEAGIELVDGAISGGPPTAGFVTTFYLAGPAADRVAQLGTGSELHRVVVGSTLGTASAVKMCTASIYKGFTALMMQALLTARAHGVTQFVLDDVGNGYGGKLATAATQIATAAAKSDRFTGEMRQIAQTQGDAGLRPELFEAMALIFEQAARSELAGLAQE